MSMRYVFCVRAQLYPGIKAALYPHYDLERLERLRWFSIVVPHSKIFTSWYADLDVSSDSVTDLLFAAFLIQFVDHQLAKDTSGITHTRRVIQNWQFTPLRFFGYDPFTASGILSLLTIRSRDKFAEIRIKDRNQAKLEHWPWTLLFYNSILGFKRLSEKSFNKNVEETCGYF